MFIEMHVLWLGTRDAKALNKLLQVQAGKDHTKKQWFQPQKLAELSQGHETPGEGESTLSLCLEEFRQRGRGLLHDSSPAQVGPASGQG